MDEYQSLLNDLLATGQFREAVEAAVSGRLKALNGKLRYHVRNGQHEPAAWVEGQLTAYESVLVLFEQYVKNGR